MSKKKKSKKGKYVKGIIKDIRILTTKEIPDAISKEKYKDVKEYISTARTELNILLIEAALGCEIKTKGDGKVKFNHKLPSKSNLSDLCELLQTFIDNVENPFLAKMTNNVTTVSTDAGDMEVPLKFDMRINGEVKRVRMLDKPDNKRLKKEIFDKDMIRNVKIDVTDMMRLAAMGEDARKKENKKKMLIIGGVVILLTGAVVAGIVIYNHNKEEDIMIGDDIVDGDIPDIDMDDGDADIPQVEI